MKRMRVLLLALLLSFSFPLVAGATEGNEEVQQEEVQNEEIQKEDLQETDVQEEEIKQEEVPEVPEVQDEIIMETADDEGVWKEGENGRWYYYLDGKMVKGQEIQYQNNLYLLAADGSMKTGWVGNGVDWSFYRLGGGQKVRNNWVEDRGIWYYMDDNSKMVYHKTLTIGNSVYTFNGTGAMVKGWLQDGSNWYFYTNSGAMVRDNWVLSNGRWYYMLENGLMFNGSKMEIGGTNYYFNKGGDAVTGWYMIDGQWYYFNSDSHLEGGWIQVGSGFYYLDPETNVMVTGWKYLNNSWYYFHKTSGRMVDDWAWDGSNWYLMGGDGRMLEGWQSKNGYWYYLFGYKDPRGGPRGAMAHSREIDGYRLDASGRWVTGPSEGMRQVIEGYSSPTNYLLAVDCNTHHVGVFERSGGSWTNIAYWLCGDGAPGTPTIKGVYHVGIKGHHFVSHGLYCYWYTQILGDYLFHSVPYYPGGNAVYDDRLGVGVSAGCVRLPIDQAKWIYDTIPSGTTIVIY
ncbi:glucan-binding YG repeat protein [Aequitasia blattaphilus]|uniref:L,D-transpeptidase family protein n=1 Tax=Aequitasia blattaphilus TaxID=2949332 RepID=A0ABT1E5V2_9FIRM|nr:L,D-transpeptidase family protein [Aequitasia blattaphilus]MCP1101217.1 L,D-transpeptidase family protein [Aequitasia blattaphilus]MCR8613857.1 L,D-transpeptidase family protein [Aequitasia blattaphilus]